MFQHLSGLKFFDPSMLPERLTYLSAYRYLETEGLKGLMAVLRREIRARRATVLVIDGLVAATEAAQTDDELKKFVLEIQTNAVFNGCTVFLLTSGGVQRVNAEHTMVDGLLELEDRLFEVRAERSIQVRKFRGAGPLRGKHAFCITDDGITVYPRIESLYAQPPQAQSGAKMLETGIPSLDALIVSGGLPAQSATVVVGSSGTGKTTLGLHFLAGSTPAQPGLMVGFFESPDRLRAKARMFGLDFEGLEASGALALLWHPQREHVLDQLGHAVLCAVAERNVKRLVVDGLSGFFESAVYPERISRFFSCLVNELRGRGVTVLMTLETRDVIGSTVSIQYGFSGFLDNLVFLRFVQESGIAKRLLTIIKMRDSDFDTGLHELVMDRAGIRIAGVHEASGDVFPSAAPADVPAGPQSGDDDTARRAGDTS
jgi:circadian clock protein KaiC